jgi:cytochrome P450
MVSVILPDFLRDASSLQIALGAFTATLLTYKLLFPSRAPHEEYAKKHGLKHIKLAKQLPQSHFLLGDAVELSQNATRFIDWMYEKTVEMDEQPWLRHVPSLPDTIMLATPALIEDVVRTQNDIFGKGQLTRTVFDGMGTSFFVLDGLEWFHQRSIATKFFSPRMLRDIATPMLNKHAEVFYSVLEKSCGSHEPVNLTKLFHELTLQQMIELGFGFQMDLIGSEHGHPLDRAMEAAMRQVLYRMQTPEWFWKLQRFLNVGSERTFRRVASEVHGIVGEMIHNSLAQAQSKVASSRAEATNIVELYIQAMQDDATNSGIQFSPETLRDIAIMFVFAGSDTPAVTLNWVFLMLSKHPHVEQNLRKELWDKVPELMRGETTTLTLEQTQALTYLDAVIKGTLRLYPPGPLSTRQAERDTHLVDGTFVAKGMTVTVMPYVMGRLQSIWGDDAHQLKPERFIDAATGESRVVSPFEFFSFHAGPRVCIGKHLAMLQLKLVIATLLSRYRLDMLPNDGSYKFSTMLQPKSPLLARICRADSLAN